MEFIDFLKPELAILPVVLYALGIWIKKSKCLDWKIPFILALAGIVLAVIYLFSVSGLLDARAVAALAFAGITQGFVAAAVAVMGNQMYKQITSGKISDEQSTKE